MSLSLQASSTAEIRPIRRRLVWHVCVVLALLVLYVPTFSSLMGGLWQNDSHYTHGPIVLAATVALLVLRFGDYLKTEPRAEPVPAIGWPLLLVGLVMYVVGRSQEFPVLDAASVIPVILGCVLIFFGWGLASKLWFPFVFMLFLVPIPGSILDAVSQPLKMGVSVVVEWVLYGLGYPIGRSGVTLTIGQYVLLVADACSGLNSFLMLEAFGLLYMNVVRHPSPLRNMVLALFIMPLSFVTNAVRVIALVLITYYFGDEAGSGFLHGAAGLLVFGVALGIICLGDSLARVVARRFDRKSAGKSA